MQKRVICLLPSCVPRQQSSFGAEAWLDWQRRGGTENPRGLNPQKIAKKKKKDIETTSENQNSINLRSKSESKVEGGLEDSRISEKEKNGQKKPKKNLSFSLIERVILSAGAMLIFSVFLRFDRVSCDEGKCLYLVYVPWFGGGVGAWSAGAAMQVGGRVSHVTGFKTWRE